MLQRLKNIYHLAIEIYWNIVCGFPGKKLFVIGVTGTDGKTTTSTLISHVLESNGFKVGIQSTLSSLHATTPGKGETIKFLKRCVDAGKTHVVLEVTSHAIAQNRIWGIPFQIGVLTNIANNEHLDFHKTFENYRNTKLSWLLECHKIVANADDLSFSVLQKKIVDQKLITYGLKSKVDFGIKDVPGSKLLGEFNKYNILAAVAVCRELNLKRADIEKSVATFNSPPGRLEVVVSKPFYAIVDFAHTPQSFEKVLPVAQSLKRLYTRNKLIHVFGATGDRFKGKRPILAQIAAKFDDYVFLTHEDTYSENKNQILSEIENGFKDVGFKNYEKILDREEAIKKAVKMAKPGDVVILTGLGHQRSMNINGKEVLINEPELVRRLVK